MTDQAVYQVKREGREWFVFRAGNKASPPLRTKSEAETHLIQRMASDLRYLDTCFGLGVHRGTTITELEEIVDTVIRCGSCGDATNNAEPFCNGPICIKRGD